MTKLLGCLKFFGASIILQIARAEDKWPKIEDRGSRMATDARRSLSSILDPHPQFCLMLLGIVWLRAQPGVEQPRDRAIDQVLDDEGRRVGLKQQRVKDRQDDKEIHHPDQHP